MTDGRKDASDVLFGDGISERCAPVAWKNTKRVQFRVLEQFSAPDYKRDKVGQKTTERLYWKNGQTTTEVTDAPVLIPVLNIQTALKDWEGTADPKKMEGDDTGKRSLWLNGRKAGGSVRDALRAACIKAGVGAKVNGVVRKIEEGDFGEVWLASGRGNVNSPYMFEAVYWRHDAADLPEWAKDLPADAKPDTDAPSEDDLFN